MLNLQRKHPRRCVVGAGRVRDQRTGPHRRVLTPRCVCGQRIDPRRCVRSLRCCSTAMPPLPSPCCREPLVFSRSASSPVAVLNVPSVFATSARTPVAVFASPVSVKFPAPTPTNVLSPPKLWMKRSPSFRMFPVAAVEFGRLMFADPAGHPNRELFTAVIRSAMLTMPVKLQSPQHCAWPGGCAH